MLVLLMEWIYELLRWDGIGLGIQKLKRGYIYRNTDTNTGKWSHKHTFIFQNNHIVLSPLRPILFSEY
jgi:hypothetical protein